MDYTTYNPNYLAVNTKSPTCTKTPGLLSSNFPASLTSYKSYTHHSYHFIVIFLTDINTIGKTKSNQPNLITYARLLLGKPTTLNVLGILFVVTENLGNEQFGK